MSSSLEQHCYREVSSRAGFFDCCCFFTCTAIAAWEHMVNEMNEEV